MQCQAYSLKMSAKQSYKSFQDFSNSETSVWNRTKICQLITHYIPRLQYVFSNESNVNTLSLNSLPDFIQYCGDVKGLKIQKNMTNSGQIIFLNLFGKRRKRLSVLDVIEEWNSPLIIGLVSYDDYDFLQGETPLVSFISDPSNAFLKYYLRWNEKISGHLFLNNSSNHQLFEIIRDHFDEEITMYFQSMVDRKLTGGDLLLRKHLLVVLILLYHLNFDLQVVCTKSQREWLHKISNNSEKWAQLFDKVDQFIKLYHLEKEKRQEQFKTIANEELRLSKL